MDKIIAERLNTNRIGYNQEIKVLDKNNMMQYITAQDLKSFGLIPELCGRFPMITYLSSLGREALKRILLEPTNALIKQYERLFVLDGIDLSFTEDGIDYIVDKTITLKLGARGLRSIMEHIMTNAMFELPSSNEKKIEINRKYAAVQMGEN
jgi:ATP-dependent Clp protease ATP-binding subunit ClpX